MKWGTKVTVDMNFKPSPSDFSKYVYCPAKWALSHKYSYKQIQNEYLLLGQQNEDKCINWILGKYHAPKEQILFNGTGNNNFEYLTAEIKSINMHCQPDLILSNYNRNLLFEFKAVKDPYYLSLYEFDSVHAQIWCYTYLKEIHIDEYHLLSYFIDPNRHSFFYSSYKHKKLLSYELAPSNFERLFKKYIAAIELLGQCDTEIKQLDATKAKKLLTSIFSSPKKSEVLKCNHCIYKQKHICEIQSF